MVEDIKEEVEVEDEVEAGVDVEDLVAGEDPKDQVTPLSNHPEKANPKQEREVTQWRNGVVSVEFGDHIPLLNTTPKMD